MQDTDLTKIMTFKSGKFVFSRRFDKEELMGPLIEANILRTTVQDLPILPDLAARLEEEVIRRSIFGTAAIEGNPLREEEVAKIVSGADKQDSPERANQEIRNLKKAYDYLAGTKQEGGGTLLLDEKRIKEIHSIITNNIMDDKNMPGQYRNHRVKVGDESHGGVYTPPKVIDDIDRLMAQFTTWINSPEVTSLNPMIRAALAHYHLALIHPFGDGNGRTCRLIEALLMKSSGLTYVPVMLSNYYYTHIDDYFWAFSISRKNKDHDVTHFVRFVLNGVIGSLEEIKDGIIYFIRKFTLRDYYLYLRNKMGLNKRHYEFLNVLLERPGPFSFDDLYNKAVFRTLYKDASPRTARRDLAKMCDLNLLLCERGVYSLNFRVLG